MRGRSRTGKGLEFGRNASGFDGSDPLEYLQRLAQVVLGLGGMAGGQGAAAQPGQCVSLVPGAGDSAGPGLGPRLVS